MRMRGRYTEKKIEKWREEIDSKKMLEGIFREVAQHMESMHKGLSRVQLMERVLMPQDLNPEAYVESIPSAKQSRL